MKVLVFTRLKSGDEAAQAVEDVVLRGGSRNQLRKSGTLLGEVAAGVRAGGGATGYGGYGGRHLCHTRPPQREKTIVSKIDKTLLVVFCF